LAIQSLRLRKHRAVADARKEVREEMPYVLRAAFVSRHTPALAMCAGSAKKLWKTAKKHPREKSEKLPVCCFSFVFPQFFRATNLVRSTRLCKGVAWTLVCEQAGEKGGWFFALALLAACT